MLVTSVARSLDRRLRRTERVDTFLDDGLESLDDIALGIGLTRCLECIEVYLVIKLNSSV